MADADPKFDPAIAIDATEVLRKRRWLRPLLMFGVPVLLIAAAAAWWSMSGGTVSTDNAYVQQEKVSIGADVAGRIVEVTVRENQPVKAGDVLFRIDPEPYRIALAQADAAIASAQVQVTTLQASYAGTGADIQAARDTIASAQEDFDRQQALMRRGFTTRARFDQAKHSVEQARATFQRAVADSAEARSKLSSGSAVPGVNPAIAAARAQREKALLDLSRTTRRAPVGGIVSQSDRLQVGQMMMSGLPALTIVRSGGSWIEANFKETDLDKMRVGQTATVEFDAYPDLKLKGHVASIGAGTGSEFAILPAQNANGNWVKVTQRIPVRIAIDDQSPRRLIAGLTAEVTVHTGK
ncbi:HlyD family secretion protein [Sphingomonas sp. MG17]|uniref:HlyD family secretion protein n=1 Tax=Sphingomonas tagetis TaxID=2949092 RepID=A0A9X2HGN5_9SPHN|nr:HlyD family secretion protein [Sphingomonas tagetis]MCP3729202.1 HlyD family secretion protein [Sphingomonas tagetis]